MKSGRAFSASDEEAKPVFPQVRERAQVEEHWTACEYPERELDGASFHVGRNRRCGCRIAADARIRRLRASGADPREIRRAEVTRTLMDAWG